MIRDPIAVPSNYGQVATSVSGVALPLHRKGVEKDRFDLAITWLKCDIEQILNSRKITYDIREGMLANVYTFFNSDL
jgi:hypothetical protein